MIDLEVSVFDLSKKQVDREKNEYNKSDTEMQMIVRTVVHCRGDCLTLNLKDGDSVPGYRQVVRVLYVHRMPASLDRYLLVVLCTHTVHR